MADGKLTVADSRTVPNEAGIQQLVGRSVHFDAPKNSEVRYVGQILPVQPASCSKVIIFYVNPFLKKLPLG